jgi:hypothetical protein
MLFYSRLFRVLLLVAALLQSGCFCWRHCGHRCCYERPGEAPIPAQTK